SVTLRGVPKKPLIESMCREQSQYHDRPEGPRAPADDDGCKRLNLHQGGQERDSVNVEHRPSSYEFHQTKKLAALQTTARRAAPCRIEQHRQCENLQQR